MLNLNPQWIRVEIRDDNGRIVGEMFVEKYTRLRIRVVPRAAITGPTCFGDWSGMGCYVLASDIDVTTHVWTGRPGSGRVNKRVHDWKVAPLMDWFTHVFLIDWSVLNDEGKPGEPPKEHTEYVEGGLIHAVRDSQFGILHNERNAGQNAALTPSVRAWLDMVIDCTLRFLAGRGYSTAAPSITSGTAAVVAAVGDQTRARFDIGLAELFASGRVAAGQTLTRHCDVSKTAVLHDANDIEFQGVHYQSLSAASDEAAAGTETNGWDYWSVTADTGGFKRMKTVRAEEIAARETAYDAVEDAA